MKDNTKTANTQSLGHRIKEFIHPSNVTWKNKKDTTHDSVVVLGFVALSAIFLFGADSLFGFILGLVL